MITKERYEIALREIDSLTRQLQNETKIIAEYNEQVNKTVKVATEIIGSQFTACIRPKGRQ